VGHAQREDDQGRAAAALGVLAQVAQVGAAASLLPQP
jgi:hypothetical protein